MPVPVLGVSWPSASSAEALSRYTQSGPIGDQIQNQKANRDRNIKLRRDRRRARARPRAFERQRAPSAADRGRPSISAESLTGLSEERPGRPRVDRGTAGAKVLADEALAKHGAEIRAWLASAVANTRAPCCMAPGSLGVSGWGWG